MTQDNEEQDEARLVVDVPKDLHKRCRLQALEDDETLRDFVQQALERELRRRGG